MIIPAPSKETHIKIIAQVLFNYISDYKVENHFTGKFKMFVNSFSSIKGSRKRILGQGVRIARGSYNCL
jgi:hypothetical protein